MVHNWAAAWTVLKFFGNLPVNAISLTKTTIAQFYIQEFCSVPLGMSLYYIEFLYNFLFTSLYF